MKNDAVDHHIVRSVCDALRQRLRRSVDLHAIFVDFSDVPGRYLVEYAPSGARFLFNEEANELQEIP